MALKKTAPTDRERKITRCAELEARYKFEYMKKLCNIIKGSNVTTSWALATEIGGIVRGKDTVIIGKEAMLQECGFAIKLHDFSKGKVTKVAYNALIESIAMEYTKT